ncbi:MAG: hypothetical protein M1813_000257 [Trichoglossum hirsutum]|nr:MAG: hypothetical protein M1813_000257 [Trichoglossum hirsutum]
MSSQATDALRIYHSPSTLAIAIGTAILAGLGGFLVGQASAAGVFGFGEKERHQPREHDDSEEENEKDEEEEEEEEEEECKLVLVVRSDLSMSKGKTAAQCSHATLACYKSALLHHDHDHPRKPSPRTWLRRWERGGQAKVVVQVRGEGGEGEAEAELAVLRTRARSLGVVAELVRDAGRTQVAAGSATVLGVGPAPKGLVDRVTGGLKLL